MKILVGTDFTELSARAADRALDLARDCRAELTLVHVVEPVDDPGSEDPETEAFYEKLKTKSKEKLLDECRRLHLSEDATSVVVGHRHQALIDLADRMQADLLIVGSRPLSGPEDRPGVGHRVALMSTRPVLLVP